MKKIPTLFERIYENNKIVGITPKVTPGMEWVLKGEGTVTVKWDGACCAIIDGELFEPCMRCGTVHGRTVKGFTVTDRVELINCETKNFFVREVGDKVFFTKEEAKRALEKMKGETE